MIDAFYTYDNFKMISLLLDSFNKLTHYPIIKRAIVSSELSDKVCWLLTRKEESFKDIRFKALSLLDNLVSELTVERVIRTLKGKIKSLLKEKDDELVSSSL